MSATPVIGEREAERLEQLVMAAADLPDPQELVECLCVRAKTPRG